MRKILTLAAILATLSTPALARDTYVHGYERENGTYVQPHYQSAPDNNVYNNYSTQGNTNPYTGQQGMVNPYQDQNNNTGYNGYGNRR